MARSTPTSTTRAAASGKAPASASDTGASKTTRTATEAAGAAGPGGVNFDPRGNKRALLAERTAAANGEKLTSSEFVVAPGKTVRQNGQRLREGETVQLSAADGERMVANGSVVEGKRAAEVAKKLTDAKTASDADQDATAQAFADQQRKDEEAAAAAEAERLAQGQLSGALNR